MGLRDEGRLPEREGQMMRLKFLVIVVSVMLFSFSTAALAGAGSDVSAVMRAGGGAVGGAGFVMLTGVSKIVSNAYPKVSITVVPGGWVGNITRVNVGELDLASTANTLCGLAEKGLAPLNKPFPDVRALFSVQDTMYYFMYARKDFPVDSVEELIEKKIPARICTLSPGSVTEMQFKNALAARNVTWDDIKQWGGKVNFVKWGDGVSLIKDGHADLICAAALGKAGWAMELATVRDMKVLKWSPELLDAINQKTGTKTASMPGGLYKGIDDAVDCPASSGEIIINAKVADEVAYAIVKAMAEGADEYRNHHAAFRGFTAEGMPTGLFLPLHPGAVKYYKEMGYMK
jgi:TRAP transporter TAXI family solute receptor